MKKILVLAAFISCVTLAMDKKAEVNPVVAQQVEKKDVPAPAAAQAPQKQSTFAKLFACCCGKAETK